MSSSLPSHSRDCCKKSVRGEPVEPLSFFLREERAFDTLRPSGFWPNGFWMPRLLMQQSRKREGKVSDSQAFDAVSAAVFRQQVQRRRTPQSRLRLGDFGAPPKPRKPRKTRGLSRTCAAFRRCNDTVRLWRIRFAPLREKVAGRRPFTGGFNKHISRPAAPWGLPTARQLSVHYPVGGPLSCTSIIARWG